MKLWLASSFVIVSLACSVLAGMPLHSDNGPMAKCCEAAKQKVQTPETRSTSLCCAVSCSADAPAPSPNSLTNFSPVAVDVYDSITNQIAALLASQQDPVPAALLERDHPPPQAVRPFFLRNHAFLI